MSQFRTSRHALQPPEIESGCAGAVCDISAVVLIALVLFGAVLGTLAFLGCLRRAQEACSEEIDRVIAERDAFEMFVDRIGTLDPVAVRPDGGPRVGATLLQPENAAMERVRTAYQETVMDVPHYEADYGEPLADHMAAELGNGVAAAVTTDASLTPSIHTTLLSAGRTASSDREVLAETLRTELDDLTIAESTLERTSERFERTGGRRLRGRTFHELESRWRRLDRLEDECETLIEQRQETLQDHGGTERMRSPAALSSYLYSDLDVSFPVLSASTDLLDQLREEKGHTIAALSRKRA